MKVLTIMAGPHKSGNTATVLGWVEDELKSSGHSIERVELRKHNIKDCIGCLVCQEGEDFRDCAQTDDDANEILSRIVAADAAVFASPLYYWSFTAPMHALIDRSLSLTKGYEVKEQISKLDGTPAALLVTCMDSIEGNADLVGTIFDRLCNYSKMKKIDALIVPLCTTPDKIGEQYQEQARDLARSLVL